MRIVILIFMSLAGGIICSRFFVSVFRENQRDHMVNTLRTKDARTGTELNAIKSLFMRGLLYLSDCLKGLEYCMLYCGLEDLGTVAVPDKDCESLKVKALQTG